MDKLNESRLYLAPSLKNYLKKYKNDEVVSTLLDFEGKESGKDFTLIDVDGDNFSYSSAKVIDKGYRNKMSMLDEENVDKVDIGTKFFQNEISNILASKDRSTIKIGRLINSIFPNKFSNVQIAKFVDIVRNKNVNKYEFKIVSGDDIKAYYNSENCADYDPNDQYYSTGTLGRSCMMDKGEKISKIFDIYTKNPDVCRMLVMLNKGELVARALLWNVSCVDQKDEREFEGVFLDRIYYQYSWMVKSMLEYASENNYITKYYLENGGYEAHKSINYCLVNGIFHRLRMTVNIRKIFYKSFPYLDTFQYYDVKNGLLSNYRISGFKLNDIGGDYGESGGIINRFRNYSRKFKKEE